MTQSQTKYIGIAMNKEFYTPEIDQAVERYGLSPFGRQGEFFEYREISEILVKLLESLQVIKPYMDGQEKVRYFWVNSNRGPMSAFVNDEEYEEMKESGEIQDRHDLETLRDDYYPEEINWHKVFFQIYDDILFFGFGSKIIFQLNIKTTQIAGTSYKGKKLVEFLLWVQSRIENEISKALKDIDAYNDWLDSGKEAFKK